jgi:hypothetical protein
MRNAREQSISAEAASDRVSGRVVEPKRSSEPAHWELPFMARFAAVRSRGEVKQANYLRLIVECQEKMREIQRTPAARTITRFHAARAAIRKLSGRILNATSRVASCRGHERALHRLSRETAPPQHVRRAVRGREGTHSTLWQRHSELAGCTPRQLANESAHRPLLLAGGC